MNSHLLDGSIIASGCTPTPLRFRMFPSAEPYGYARLWISIILGLQVMMAIVGSATSLSETDDQSNT